MDSSTPAPEPALEVLIGAGAGDPEELLRISVPRSDGRITVRGWSGRDWSRVPEDRERDAVELLRELERAVRVGRSLRPELARVRDWLRRR